MNIVTVRPKRRSTPRTADSWMALARLLDDESERAYWSGDDLSLGFGHRRLRLSLVLELAGDSARSRAFSMLRPTPVDSAQTELFPMVG